MVNLTNFAKEGVLGFEIPQEIKEGEVAVGIAVTTEDQIGRLCIATERYQLEGYLDDVENVTVDCEPELLIEEEIEDFEERLTPAQLEKFHESGLVVHFPLGSAVENFYIDKYLWRSVPIVAKDSTGYIASARLILTNGENSLPTLTAPEIVLYDDWKDEAGKAQAEMSQLAKVKGGHSGAMVGMLRIAQLYSKKAEIDSWIATTDNRVVKLLNGLMKFNILQIGDPVRYLGSESTPGLINIEGSLQSIKTNGSQELERFLRGEQNVKGFEWYKGV